jgi:hypothetical protein
VVRTAEAIRFLDRAGFGHEAAPLRRTVLDHTLALLWLVRDPAEVVACYTWHHHSKQHALGKEAEAGDWNLSDIPLPAQPAKSEKPARYGLLLRPDELAEYLGFSAAYVAFMFETAFVHPTVRGADAYVVSEEGQIGLLAEPRSDEIPLHSSALLVGMASDALGELLEDDGLLELARQIKTLLAEASDSS